MVKSGPHGEEWALETGLFYDDAEFYDNGFDAYETVKLRQDGTEVREYFKWNDEGCRFEECQRPPALRYNRKVHACVQSVKRHLEI